MTTILIRIVGQTNGFVKKVEIDFIYYDKQKDCGVQGLFPSFLLKLYAIPLSYLV